MRSLAYGALVGGGISAVLCPPRVLCADDELECGGNRGVWLILRCSVCDGKAVVGDMTVGCFAQGAAVPTKELGAAAVLGANGAFALLEGKAWNALLYNPLTVDFTGEGWLEVWIAVGGVTAAGSSSQLKSDPK